MPKYSQVRFIRRNGRVIPIAGKPSYDPRQDLAKAAAGGALFAIGEGLSKKANKANTLAKAFKFKPLFASGPAGSVTSLSKFKVGRPLASTINKAGAIAEKAINYSRSPLGKKQVGVFLMAGGAALALGAALSSHLQMSIINALKVKNKPRRK